jgi:hypothetical protein
MNKYESVIDSIFLSNNGEIDLLTGAISPDRFDQIVKRDAIQRGTPILDVLNNQVVALNKQINLELLKKSGKSEIALLIPVVFLILPVSISFAIWPSIYGLNQAGF